jgi:hypothetical protein
MLNAGNHSRGAMTMVSYSLECKFVTKDHHKDQNYNRRGGGTHAPSTKPYVLTEHVHASPLHRLRHTPVSVESVLGRTL